MSREHVVRAVRRAGVGGALAVAASLLAVLAAERPIAAARPVAQEVVGNLPGPAGSMRADVTLRQWRVKADGQPLSGPHEPISVRLLRRHIDGKWKTTMSYRARPAAVQSRGGLLALENPFEAARVELDEESGRAEVFDKFNRPLGVPDDESRRRFGLTDEQVKWNATGALAEATQARVNRRAVEGGGFLATRSRRADRRADLQRRFGRPAGRVRGLDRFLHVDRDETQEVLVDPDAALPVEINRLRGGAVGSHMTLEYIAHGTVGHVRRLVRDEVTQAGTGPRLVTEVAVTNIALATGGAQ